MIPSTALLAVIFAVLALGLLATSAKKVHIARRSTKWWQSASLYQIYPRSFKDSDGDGVGDLRGISENLEYLRDIGINAVWLSPIFTSPMADFGYDISNFTQIDPLFGSMEDLESLLAKAKRLSLKILLDFVPNHTSDQHSWFQLSVKKDPKYKDHYIWHPGYVVDGVRQPPSNWISVFRGSAWTWNEVRQEYYFHQFLPAQPDLNYRNPNVLKSMESVMKFWLKKGVDGFRVDAVKHIFEKAPGPDGRFMDEPRNPAVSDPASYDYLNHTYTTDQPETIQLLYQWHQMLADFQKKNGGDDRVLLAESYSSLDILAQYYGDGNRKGATFPFNFQLFDIKNDSTAVDYTTIINKYRSSLPEGATANWLVGNHDQPRVANRVGKERILLMNTLVCTLPGVCITYQGEELGMTDVPISWADTQDPQGCNTNPMIYQAFSRDPERTPLQWNKELNAGFSTAKKTWLPVADNYQTVNVESELLDKKSTLNFYKQIQALRREKTFRLGKCDVTAFGRDIVINKRSLDDEYTYLVVMNTRNKIQFVDISEWSPELSNLECVIANRKSQHKPGDIISSSSMLVMPWEVVIWRSKYIVRQR